MTHRVLRVTLDCSTNVGMTRSSLAVLVGIYINQGVLVGLTDMLGGIANPSLIIIPVFVVLLSVLLLKEELVISP
jgi:hypothetical protein